MIDEGHEAGRDPDRLAVGILFGFGDRDDDTDQCFIAPTITCLVVQQVPEPNHGVSPRGEPNRMGFGYYAKRNSSIADGCPPC